MRPLRAALLALVVAWVPATGAAAAPADLAQTVRDLGDGRWEVRRAAERTLEAEGVALLEGDDDPARLAAFDRAVDAALADGNASVRAAARRVLRRLEERTTDADARRLPRLLVARLERLLPQVVLPARGDDGGGLEAAANRIEAHAGAFAAEQAVRGLLPEANDALVTVVSTTRDARALAGAVVVLCPADGRPPTDEAMLRALRAAYDRAPSVALAAGRFAGADGASPSAALTLALAVAGRTKDVAALVERGAVGDTAAFDTWLRAWAERAGRGDLLPGTFLARMQEGRVAADAEATAAARALAAGVPWLARLLAGRALFLEPGRADATATLVTAYAQVALRGEAARAAGRTPTPEETDDPRAVVVEEGLRGGRFSERLLLSREGGETRVPGLLPAAIVDGRLVHGTASGHVALVTLPSGEDVAVESTRVTRPPKALVVSGRTVWCVTALGGLWRWEVTDHGFVRVGTDAGPFLAMATGRDGTVWLAGPHRAISRGAGHDAPVAVGKAGRREGVLVRGLSVLDDGRLVVYARGEVTRLNPETGEEKVLVPAERAPHRATAFGREVLVGYADGWERLDADGTVLLRVDASEGQRLAGLAGDPKAGVVYAVYPEAVLACDAATGAPRWAESVGGSGDPVVAGDLLLVSAGTGPPPLGDNRFDRTVYVLRAGVPEVDPFGTEVRVKAVEAAVAAAEAGATDVAEALLDPLRGWFTPSEEWAANAALREALDRRAREAGPKAPGPR